MQVWNVLHAARWKYRTQKSRQRSPSGHHRRTLSGYIFATKACVDNRKKIVKQQYVLQMSSQYGEIVSLVWGTHQISTAFASWQRYCTACSSWRQPNFAALNRGRHLRSAGRPSRLALARISGCELNCWRLPNYDSWFHTTANSLAKRQTAFHYLLY